MVYSIQYLRGLAALLVIVQHVAVKGAQYAGNPMPWYHIGGEAGVELFFIISGFIMCHTTAEKSGKKTTVGNFLKNRFTRILPLYWSVTLVALIVFLLLPHKVNIGGGETKILESFLLLPTTGVYLIKNGWTLSYEFFYYFLFSIGMLFPRRFGHLVTSLILIALVVSHFFTKSESIIIASATSPLLFDFVLGILVYELYSRVKRVPVVLSVLLMLTGCTMLVLLNRLLITELPLFCVGIACFFLCAGLVFLEDPIKNHEIPFLTLLGDASYSLYLFHPFVLAGLALLLAHFGFNRGIYAWPFLIIIGTFALIGGILCYRHYEKPMTTFIRSLVGK